MQMKIKEAHKISIFIITWNIHIRIYTKLLFTQVSWHSVSYCTRKGQHYLIGASLLKTLFMASR